MGSSDRKVHSLKIDTSSINTTTITTNNTTTDSNNINNKQTEATSSLPSLSSWSDENDDEEELMESPKQLTNCDWNKIFETESIVKDVDHPVKRSNSNKNGRNNHHNDHYQQQQPSYSAHKTSEVTPTTLLRNMSVSDLPSLMDYTNTNKSSCTTPSTKRDNWFQMSRNAVKRYLSTPPTRRGYGGLKAGSVEPPEPPPQLLFNLEWSKTANHHPKLHQRQQAGDVNNHVNSTPSSPVLKRHSMMMAMTPDHGHSELSPASSFSSFSSFSFSSASTTSLSSTTSATDSPTFNRPYFHSPSSSTSSFSTFSSTTPSFNGKEYDPQRRCSLPANELFNNSRKELTSPKSSLQKRSVTRSPGSLLQKSSKTKTTKIGDDCFNIPTLYFSGEPVIIFSNIKSRRTKLYRKVSLKPEFNALYVWRSTLNDALMKRKENHFINNQKTVPLEKKESYSLTRKFILQEFYTTEITYWNQLNYIKVMYHDPLQLAIQRKSAFVRPGDMDWFSNLSDLMDFSSTIIYQLRHYQSHFVNCIYPNHCSCENIHIGKILCEMVESMAVFLHCALDYEANIKLIKEKKKNKGYNLYKDKLSLKKETRQFNIQDYLIVPIQRITRYGLLLADLEKHTEADDVDYKHIQIARDIIHGLALAMNYAQK